MIAPALALAARLPDDRADVSGSAQLVRALVGAFTFGIASDTVIGPMLGSHGTGSMLTSAVLGAPLACAATWQLVREHRVRAMPAQLLALLAFAAWSAATILWAIRPEDAVTRAISNAQLLGFTWLGWQAIRTRRDLRAALAGYVAGALFVVAVTWRSYVADSAALDNRFVAGDFDPNDMALYVVLGVPMAVYLALGGSRVLRVLGLAYLPAAVIGLSLTGSRSGLLAGATAAAVIAVWAALTKRATAIAVFALITAGVGAAASLAPDTLARFFTLKEGFETIGDRAAIWRAGMKILELGPLVGIGAGGFARAVAGEVHQGAFAHNTPLSITIELGAVGLLLFGLAIALVLRGVRRSGGNEKGLVWALLLAWCVGTATLSWEFRKPTWFILLVGTAAGALRSASASARPGERGTSTASDRRVG